MWKFHVHVSASSFSSSALPSLTLCLVKIDLLVLFWPTCCVMQFLTKFWDTTISLQTCLVAAKKRFVYQNSSWFICRAEWFLHCLKPDPSLFLHFFFEIKKNICILMRHSVTYSVPQGIGKKLSDLLLFGNCKMIEIVTWNGLREEALEAGFFFSPIRCQ